ncbi:Uncharacterised protein [Mycobacterium tuberculosis]|nr:Uncharacterised protein [Mycobacterium tuberculosis]
MKYRRIPKEPAEHQRETRLAGFPAAQVGLHEVEPIGHASTHGLAVQLQQRDIGHIDCGDLAAVGGQRQCGTRSTAG